MCPGSMASASIAYHEAGHAVVGHLLGCRVDLVTIDPDAHEIKYEGDGVRGFCKMSLNHVKNDAVIIMTYAGVASENWFCGNNAKCSEGDARILFKAYATQRDAMNSSHEEAEELARYIGDTLYQRAVAMIDEHFLLIYAVARHVARHRSLTRDQFLSVIGHLSLPDEHT